jgi:hypothetical protein
VVDEILHYERPVLQAPFWRLDGGVCGRFDGVRKNDVEGGHGVKVPIWIGAGFQQEPDK